MWLAKESMIETDTQDNKKVKQPSRPTSMIETDRHDRDRIAESKELQKWAKEQARVVELEKLRRGWEAEHREEPGYDNGMTMGHPYESATLDVIVSSRVCIQARVGQGLR